MTDQSNSAAERSAHVTRGAARASENILAEVAPGVFKLKPLVEAEREIERLRAERDRLQQERDRLAADLAQAHRDIGPWIARVWQLIAALDQAEQALREAGAVYGADAALAALRKEIKA
jgi:chromosome segregation ATPase